MKNSSLDIFDMLNPVYTSLIIRIFLEGYTLEKGNGCFLLTSYTVLPLLLSEESRKTIINKTKSNNFLNWITKSPEIKVGFNEKVKNLEKYSKQALLFGIQAKLFYISEEGNLELGDSKVDIKKFSIDREIKEIMQNSKKYGHWCGKLQKEREIFYNLGVQL